ncbi:hypothetical protein BHE74_00035875 [Ensete ventricosum]|nr:hypothetical protein BHE74_00035875 [Ensete ventricosum]
MGESSSASYIRMVRQTCSSSFFSPRWSRLMLHGHHGGACACGSSGATLDRAMPRLPHEQGRNKEFFQAYMKDQEEKTSEMEAVERRIQKMLAETAAKDSDKED